MSKGTVKWFNSAKGYGFIKQEDNPKDIYVHISALQEAGISQLNEGQAVSYEVMNNKGKQFAANLKLI